MSHVNSREKILNSIQKSLAENQLPMPFPEAEKFDDFYEKSEVSLAEKFASEFIKLGGKFIYCANEVEMLQQLESLADAMAWPLMHSKDKFLLTLFAEHNFQKVKQASQDMHDLEVGVSTCECVVARTGSVILTAAQDYGRALPVYSPIHITIAFANQLVWDIDDSIALLQQKYDNQLPSLISLTTGPSRTADIEKTLVVGVHGPKEVYVFLIDKK